MPCLKHNRRSNGVDRSRGHRAALIAARQPESSEDTRQPSPSTPSPTSQTVHLEPSTLLATNDKPSSSIGAGPPRKAGQHPQNGQVDIPSILKTAAEILHQQNTPSLRTVINATGIVLHTGLGRSPLCDAAVKAVADVAAGYCNLELELNTGQRGRRSEHVSGLLTALTGAEAATAVNNNAAATLLIMRVLCEHREVIVSRGQLVEIGGSFRMPDVMQAGGATLREVGTTNRTRIDDYADAVNERTAALLRVHHSNFRMIGFTEEPTIEEISRCAHRHNLLAIDDIGSGALIDLAEAGLPDEPCVLRSVAAGADIVCFSGDKLLGGPQAGIILGRADLIRRIESHPLMRTYRLDKLVLAALDATLRQYVDTDHALAAVPTLAMLRASVEMLADRANRLDEMLVEACPDEKFYISSDVSYAGGGSLPGAELPTVVIRWKPSFAPLDDVAQALRRGTPAIVARIHDHALCFDLRTLRDHELRPLTKVVAGLCVQP